MKSLFFVFLATTAATEFRPYHNYMYNETFNATGAVMAVGYDIFSSTPTHLNWTFERRLYENETGNFTEKVMHLKPDHGNFSETADNWNVCWAIASIKDSRKSTEPVPSNCKGVVSSDCLSRLGKTLCGPDGASSSIETQNACGGDLWIGGMNYTRLRNQTGNGINLIGLFGFSSDYDKYMKESVVVALLFSQGLNGFWKPDALDPPAINCFGTDKTSLGSRDLQTVLKSSASSVAVSYAVGLTVLLVIL
ncbi:hypothetical protein VHEMI02718 [[Torrubiella] hemipterigena]|uniref:Ecp2 effector protein domain-containing protein n=1 Tax=[Torrubiella] hemipterigena TaxID=1531966 RepID=A0A0A1TBF0_9HYPO|nr:hypothetical protein VHEMI02718 [[Torrubiella] hemipterigena]